MFTFTRRKPALPPGSPPDEPLSESIRISLIIHIALVLCLLVKSIVFPSKQRLYIPSLRVDIVGLPDVLKKDLQNLPQATLPTTSKGVAEVLKKADEEARKVKKEKAAKEKADPKEMILKPKPLLKDKHKQENRLKSALARIKALDEISNDESPAKIQAIKGNKLSKGSSLDGNARESNDIGYPDVLRDRLREKWTIPIWLSRQNLSAQVTLYIDPRGRLRSFRFIKSSGNPRFDDAVKKTIHESQPFPPPPDEMAADMVTDGISFGFPL